MFSNKDLKYPDPLVNAHGPYVHGIWRNKTEQVGNEETLSGRAETIVETFVKTMRETYTDSQLSEMTFCDIGCYDGWITHEVEKRIKFKSYYGVEPRQKNIDKGNVVRAYLGIESSAIFEQGSLERYI